MPSEPCSTADIRDHYGDILDELGYGRLDSWSGLKMAMVPAERTPGQGPVEVRFRASVRNFGGFASNATTISVLKDGVQTESHPVPSLLPGEAMGLDIVVIVDVGEDGPLMPVELSARLDPEGALLDNADDNAVDWLIDADAWRPNLAVVHSDLSLGAMAELTTTVRNLGLVRSAPTQLMIDDGYEVRMLPLGPLEPGEQAVVDTALGFGPHHGVLQWVDPEGALDESALSDNAAYSERWRSKALPFDHNLVWAGWTEEGQGVFVADFFADEQGRYRLPLSTLAGSPYTSREALDPLRGWLDELYISQGLVEDAGLDEVVVSPGGVAVHRLGVWTGPLE
jgi:hypothetical protein